MRITIIDHIQIFSYTLAPFLILVLPSLIIFVRAGVFRTQVPWIFYYYFILGFGSACGMYALEVQRMISLDTYLWERIDFFSQISAVLMYGFALSLLAFSVIWKLGLFKKPFKRKLYVLLSTASICLIAVLLSILCCKNYSTITGDK